MKAEQKGQAIIDHILVSIIAITVVAIVLAAFWPVINNFINLANTTPNYNLWSPIANLWPLFLVVLTLIWVIRRFTGQSQQQAG